MLVDPGESAVHADVDGYSGDDIQRAIDRLPQAGGTVRLRAGEYTVAQPIRVPSDVSIIGAGPDATIITLARNASCHVFTNADHENGNSGIAFRNFAVDGDGDHQPRPENLKGLTFSNAFHLRRTRGVEIRSIRTRHIRQTGAHFNECVDVVVEDLHAEKLGWSGVSTSGTSRITIDRTVVLDGGRDTMHSGIHLDGGFGAVISNTRVSDCTGNGIMLDCAFSDFAHCSIEAEVTRCKRGLSLSGDAVHRLEDVAVAGRYSENREVGILVSNADHVSIIGATIERNPHYGVQLQGRNGGNNCTIARTTFRDNGVAVVELHQSEDNVVLANVMEGSGASIEMGRSLRGRFAERPPIVRTAAPPPAAEEKTAPATAAPTDTLTEIASHKLAESATPATVAAAAAAAEADRAGRPPAVEMPNAEPTDQYTGTCWICGAEATFYNRSASLRETYRCPECKASMRYQAQAALLVKLYSKTGARCIADLAREASFRSLSIFEPGVLGPFREYFRGIENYHLSDYWPDVPRGEIHEGVACQDLQKLTYPDGFFDLVITSDIFEHVRRPYDGFSEIGRVLKPGGRHVFSIPVQSPIPRKTVFRVDVSTEEDVHILPPRYHLGPGNSRHIVYNEFGQDMFDELARIGLKTHAVPFPSDHGELSRVLTFYSEKSG